MPNDITKLQKRSNTLLVELSETHIYKKKLLTFFFGQKRSLVGLWIDKISSWHDQSFFEKQGMTNLTNDSFT